MSISNRQKYLNALVIRGLLCNQCNRGIGLLDDSVTNMYNAIRYLVGEAKKVAAPGCDPG